MSHFAGTYTYFSYSLIYLYFMWVDILSVCMSVYLVHEVPVEARGGKQKLGTAMADSQVGTGY